MPGHFAYQKEIVFFYKGRHLLNLPMEEIQILLAQISGKIASKNKIRIINQMQHIHSLCQIGEKTVPAGEGRRLLLPYSLEKILRCLWIWEESVQRQKGFHAAFPVAVAPGSLRLHLDVFDGGIVAVFSCQDHGIGDDRSAQVPA